MSISSKTYLSFSLLKINYVIIDLEGEIMSLFITFEGGEGSGKSSVIKVIEEKLKEINFNNYITTREPGGIKISEDIRDILLDKNNTTMDERTEALLFAASRRQHLAEKVIPALKMGKVVLCDRFVDSSLVYQGIARGIGIDAVMNINSFAIDEYMPDVTFLLDLDPEIGLMRINKNKDREVNRLDLEKIEFHQKIREGYLFLMNKFPSRIIKIDASKDIESIASQIFNIIIKRINSEKS